LNSNNQPFIGTIYFPIPRKGELKNLKFSVQQESTNPSSVTYIATIYIAKSICNLIPVNTVTTLPPVFFPTNLSTNIVINNGSTFGSNCNDWCGHCVSEGDFIALICTFPQVGLSGITLSASIEIE